ncbi:MAG: hypothetical protein ACFFB5_17790 [Promethearchaeota archaeon]
MVDRHRRLKQFIRIVVDQLPAYIKEYHVSDRKLLEKFQSTLQHFEEADYDRDRLSKRFTGYRMGYRDTEEYLNIQFLWFTIEYFKDANQLLRVAEFHGGDFYRYLVKCLRGVPSTPGVFQLIQKKTALTDLSWEKLQNLASKLTIPLTSEELLVIKTVYSFIKEERKRKKGLSLLNPDHLRTHIVRQISPRWTYTRLSRLFAHIDARWDLWFYPPAFGMERYYCYFQVDESTSLFDIINFKDQANTALSTSDVYQIRGYHNTFLGRIVTSTQEIKRLRSYLEEHENLIVHQLSEITNTYTSWSLTQYRAERGWERLSNDEMRRLIQQLNTSQTCEEEGDFFLSRECGKQWFYKQMSDPHKIIALLCKYFKFYSFNELPWRTPRDLLRFTHEELYLLKELYRQKVAHVGFQVRRLIDEFAIDTYWVSLPKRPIEQLSCLLRYLPFCQIYYTKIHVHLWTRLPADFAHQLRTIPEWTVVPIIQNHQPQNLEDDWYDPITYEWKTPILLENHGEDLG